MHFVPSLPPGIRTSNATPCSGRPRCGAMRRLRRAGWIVLATSTVLFGGCKGSGGGSPSTPSNPPTPAPTVTSVSVTGLAGPLNMGQTVQLTAAALLSGGTTEDCSAMATWQSQNTNVATVSSVGLVTAVSVGQSEIRATCRGVTGSATVSVVWNGADFSFTPSPVPARATPCSGSNVTPSWAFRATVAETAGTGFTVQTATINYYDDGSVLIGSTTIDFSQFFASCGTGSATVPARGRACGDLCVTLGSRSSGHAALRLDVSAGGASRSATSSLLRLSPAGGATATSPFSTPSVSIFRKLDR